MIVLALASGTSADGIDLGVADLRWEDGDITLRLLAADCRPWPAGLGEAILGVLPPQTTTAARLCELDTAIGQALATVARGAMAAGADAELIVSPGQTVHHEVRDGSCLGTLQLGQPAWVAEETGLPVVSDLRARDVSAGGHGAPLASTFDALWLAGPGGPRAAVNLGGIANVTVVGDVGDDVVAWDTGPANCLIDVAAARLTSGAQRYDRGGLLAAAGHVRSDLLQGLLANRYFGASPPASTGRETFSADYLDSVLAQVPAVEPDDLVTTLTALTAVTVADALRPYGVVEVVASGGGTRNPTLMRSLATALGDTSLVTSDSRGLPAAAKEVAMWAMLGFLSWHGVPGSTAATGARGRRILGRISPGAEPLRLPEPVLDPVRRLRVLRQRGGVS